jgi:hypothetical protein
MHSAIDLQQPTVLPSRRSGATGSGDGPRRQSRGVLLFPEKEAKNGGLTKQVMFIICNISAKPSHGVWGWPQKAIS